MYLAQTNSGFLYYYEPTDSYYKNENPIRIVGFDVVSYKKLFLLDDAFINSIRHQPHLIISDRGFGIANIRDNDYDYIVNRQEMELTVQIYEDIPLFIPIIQNITVNTSVIEVMDLLPFDGGFIVDWIFQPVVLVRSGNDYLYNNRGSYYNAITMTPVDRPLIEVLVSTDIRPVNNYYRLLTDNGPVVINITDVDHQLSVIDRPDDIEHFLTDLSIIKLPDPFYIIPRIEYDILPYQSNNPFIENTVRDATFDNTRIEIILHRLSSALQRLRNNDVPDWDLSPRQMPSPIRSEIPTSSPQRSPPRSPVIITGNNEDYKIDAIGAYFSLIYNIPIKTPEFIILNGLRVNFIPFSEVSKIQIVRYELDPYLQIYAGLPTVVNMNRIITLFSSNGLTYLVKAKYDPVTQQIFNPI